MFKEKQVWLLSTLEFLLFGLPKEEAYFKNSLHHEAFDQSVSPCSSSPEPDILPQCWAPSRNLRLSVQIGKPPDQSGLLPLSCHLSSTWWPRPWSLDSRKARVGQEPKGDTKDKTSH